MRILGIIGRDDTDSHDASAAIIENGKIIAAIEQERLSHKKHAPGESPVEAINCCLKQTNLSFKDINYIAYGWLEDLEYPNDRLNNNIIASKELTTKILPKEVFGYDEIPTIYFVKHHLSHMASTYFTSGFKDAAGLVIDGQGEEESISLYEAQDHDIKLLHSFDVPYSLGLFYEAAGYYSGLGWDAPGKFMGLTSYGKSIYNIDFDVVNSVLPLQLSGLISELKISEDSFAHKWIDHFKLNYYPYKIGNGNDIMSYQDFSSSVQKILEKNACNLVKILKENVASENLVISGGVALNCSMNEAILKSGYFKNHYIFPAANDAGSSVGAALALYNLLSNNNLFHCQMHSIDLGFQFEENEIINVLKKNNIDPYKLGWEELIHRVAQDLTDNFVIGWFQGRDEMGPRALGKRSILANPQYRKNLNKINKLKGREIWRPLAPSILSEFISDFLEMSIEPSFGRFMLTTGRVSKKYHELVPMVVHIDFSTRPHVVYKEDNNLYWCLIETFRQKTGIPLICNTSFNIANQPIVHTPQDAIEIFLKTNKMDSLVIENYYFSKKR